jgi:hypothetical protein
MPATPIDLAAAVAGVVDALTAAGVRATDDPRNINTPAVLVNPPEIAYRFGRAGFTATWELWCLVADTGRHSALVAVSQLITDTQNALGWAAVSARPDNFLMPDGSSPAGYILTFTETFGKG